MSVYATVHLSLQEWMILLKDCSDDLLVEKIKGQISQQTQSFEEIEAEYAQFSEEIEKAIEADSHLKHEWWE